MRRLETNFSDPVAGSVAEIARSFVAAIVVDGYQCCAIAIAIIGRGPTVAGVFGALGADFAKENGIGQAIGNVRELRSSAYTSKRPGEQCWMIQWCDGESLPWVVAKACGILKQSRRSSRRRVVVCGEPVIV